MGVYRKLLFLVLVLCVPTLVLAVDDPASLISQGGIGWSALKEVTYRIFTTRVGDISTQLLRNIFGAMNGTLPLPGPDAVLGKLFAVFNLGLWAIAGGIVSYTTIRGVVDTSREGSALGERTQATVAFRAVIGLGLLTPKVSGYSLIQILVMWAVLQGVNLANTTWDSFVNYFALNGGDAQVQLHNPSSEEMSALLNGGIADMLRSATCMFAFKQSEQAQKKRAKQQLSQCTGLSCQTASSLSTIPNDYGIVVDATKGTLSFGGNRRGIVSTEGLCGTYAWHIRPAADRDRYEETKKTAMIALSQNLSGIAERIYTWAQTHAPEKTTQVVHTPLPACLNANKQDLNQGDYCPEALAIHDAALTYLQDMFPARMRRLQQEAAAMGGGIFSQAKRSGWMGAGMYHRQLMNSAPIITGTLDKDYLFQAQPKKGPVTLKKYSGSLALTMDNKRHLIQVKNLLSTTAEKNLLLALRLWGDPYQPEDTLADHVHQSDYLYRHRQTSLDFGGQDFDWKEPPKKIRQSTVDFMKFTTFGLSDLSNEEYDAWMKNNNSIFDQIIKSRETAVEDIVPGGDTITHKVGQDIVNLWIDSWKAWKGFSNPKERTGDPIDDLQAFGVGLMGASMNFWQTVSRHVMEAVTVLATSLTATGVITAAIGGSLYQLGDFLFNVGVTIWPLAFLIPIGMLIKAITLPVASAHSLFMLFFHVILAVLFFYLPVGLATAVPIFLTGLVLGVYVPLIPFLLFTFAAFGWLIMVIEAIAAAPLVALGVAYPVGHEFLGRSEIALMLILNVFVRPVAMILGLGAAVITAHIILYFVNDGFTYLLATSVGYFVGKGAAITFISSIGMVIIYTFIVISIITQTYGMIHQIPEQLAKWIGAMPEPSMAPSLLAEVKQGVTQTGAGMVAGAAGMIPDLKRSMTVDPGAGQGGGIAGALGGGGRR